MYVQQTTTVTLSQDQRGRFKSTLRDVQSLSDHAGFLASKVSFLLDAVLGLINLEQNNIIKIFSVAAVMFLPPTLVASVYGMNFEFMPELHKHWGYPLALLLMVASALVPYLYFRRKGWL
jgi:magnesium transporter